MWTQLLDTIVVNCKVQMWAGKHYQLLQIEGKWVLVLVFFKIIKNEILEHNV